MDIVVVSDLQMRNCMRCGKLTSRIYYCGECAMGIQEEREDIERDHLGLALMEVSSDRVDFERRLVLERGDPEVVSGDDSGYC